jgi:phosphohistidine phosphatase
MKTLLIMRHAKSSWKQAGLADDQRPLNKRGRRDAPRMGQILREVDLVPEVVISSTAVRAQQTAAAAAEASGFTGEIQSDASLYAAPAEAYLARLRQLPPQPQVVLIVGHNPGMDSLLQGLTGQDEHMPTGAIARIDLPIERWADLSQDTPGKLESFWRPREQA